MSNQSSFRIKVIKSGEDFHENAYITYSTSKTRIETGYGIYGGYGSVARARQRIMNFSAFHSSPVMITPVPSVPIVYDDNRLLSFVKKHISDQAETASLYLEDAHNHLKSCQEYQMAKLQQITWMISFGGFITCAVGAVIFSSTMEPGSGTNIGWYIIVLGGVGSIIGYFLFIQRPYGNRASWDKMIRQQIYKEIGYTGLDHTNNSFRYELDRSLEP